jgi:hypothetical protein
MTDIQAEAATGPRRRPAQSDPHETIAHIEAVPERQGVIRWESLPRRILTLLDDDHDAQVERGALQLQ